MLKAILDKQDLQRFANLIVDLISKVLMQCLGSRNKKLVMEKTCFM
jgi:hypothetical protein